MVLSYYLFQLWTPYARIPISPHVKIPLVIYMGIIEVNRVVI